eukprot:360046_1
MYTNVYDRLGVQSRIQLQAQSDVQLLRFSTWNVDLGCDIHLRCDLSDGNCIPKTETIIIPCASIETETTSASVSTTDDYENMMITTDETEIKNNATWLIWISLILIVLGMVILFLIDKFCSSSEKDEDASDNDADVE